MPRVETERLPFRAPLLRAGEHGRIAGLIGGELSGHAGEHTWPGPILSKPDQWSLYGSDETEKGEAEHR